MKNHQIEKLNNSDALWYGRKDAKYIVRFKEIGGWRKYAAIKNGKFSDNKSTGFAMGNGHLGTNSALFTTIDFI